MPTRARTCTHFAMVAYRDQSCLHRVLNTLLARGKAIISEEEKTLGDLFRSQDITPIWSENGTSVLTILIRRKTSGQTRPGGPVDRGSILFSVSTPPPDPTPCSGSKTIVSLVNQPSLYFSKIQYQGRKYNCENQNCPGFSVSKCPTW